MESSKVSKLEQANADIKTVLYNEEEIAKRNKELAKLIDEHYKGEKEDLVIIGILKLITHPHTIDFMAVSSNSFSPSRSLTGYGASATTSGFVRIVMDLRQNIAGKHVLIIEDIIDSGKFPQQMLMSGLTLKFLVDLLKTRSCKSIQCCAFLMKTKCLKVDRETLPLKFIGFEVEPVFVVGYGLDYAENYRTLPFVGELKEEVYKKK